ncbi:MAG: sigma-54-dependent Fis family transcriptional regulator [Phycisphaerae bacterium]|nr:sigma-54-dependent Fis family transcriptional regulator [Phycisphaerae bacterium]
MREEFFHHLCPQTVTLAGKSTAMLETLQTIEMVARSGCNPVLVVGPTGTGKELAAQAVHAHRHGPEETFVAVNCAALTASLLESELFGHVRGSFTGADRDKTGLFEAAGAGTIFLDEISEMPLELQAKLLRVLQEHKFRKVGGTKDIACRATIIASSNRDLLAEVEANRFRRDLYYRLAVFPIKLTALASPHRRSDIPLLAQYFLATSDVVVDQPKEGFTAAAEQLLQSHDWPGNIRELRNVISRALIMEKGKLIRPESILIDRLESSCREMPEDAAPKDFSLETAEREFIQRALQETGWQRTKAAGLLGITRATLHSKLKRYGIKPPWNENDEDDQNDESELEETYREACA